MQRLNPIHITGALRHCYLWATSGSDDVFITNKDFNNDCPMPRTIYCIHGTADRGNSFSLIADRLQDKLSDDIKGIHIITFNHRFSGASVDNFASQLSQRIKDNNDEHVILMGHSRGALVATEYALNHASDDNIHVDSVVSICGPYRGSYAAWPFAFLSNSVTQMQTDSPYLKQLSAQIQASNLRGYYIGATSDYLVTYDSYMPYHIQNDQPNVLLLDRHGHLSIMSSHRLVSWVAEQINTSNTIELDQTQHQNNR